MSFEQQTVVLVGLIGCGKTTLFNKCCNQKQRVEPGGVSVTRCVFLTESAHGKGFRMMDTPGLGSFQDRMAHACGISKALSEGDVHQILVCVKFERIDLMKKTILDFVCRKLNRFKDLITIVVTHFDACLQQGTDKSLEEQNYLQEQRKEEITKEIKKYNVQSVLFTSISDSGQSICNQIDQILENNKYGRKCVLQKTELESYFELIDESEDLQIKLLEAKGQISAKFMKIVSATKKFINSFDQQHKLLVDIMHALTLAIKEHAAILVEQYEKDHQEDFNELYEGQQEEVIYYIHAQLKAELVEAMSNVQKEAQKKMYVNSSYDKVNLKINDFIKKCPHCGLYWLKVNGCRGTTTCGNYPESDQDNIFANSQLRRFKFTFSEKQILWEENASYLQIVNNKEYQKSINPDVLKGCKKSFVWADQPSLDEARMQELCETGVLDYLANINVNYEKKQKSLAEKIEHSLQKMEIKQLQTIKQN